MSKPDKTLVPRERISYEILLLNQINNCANVRREADIFTFIICVDTLEDLLIEDLRKQLKERLKEDKIYQHYLKRYNLLIEVDKLLEEGTLRNHYDEILKKAQEIGFDELVKKLEKYKKVIAKGGSTFELMGTIEDALETYKLWMRDRKLTLIIDTLNDNGLLLRYDHIMRGTV